MYYLIGHTIFNIYKNCIKYENYLYFETIFSKITYIMKWKKYYMVWYQIWKGIQILVLNLLILNKKSENEVKDVWFIYDSVLPNK